ncbi:MAG: hypothetical protein Q8M92_01370 [Candidatus Subteraquimicrobiales bacterium]|nr:hypothetical protein [Candidatus Subteraquimicrobiales bacterium]
MSNVMEKVAAYVAMEKIAWEASDIMSDMVEQGATPPEDVYHEIEDMLNERKSKSYGLRHPYVTGIPTLGLWPAISKSKADKNIKASVLMKHPKLLEQIRGYMDKQYDRHIERAKVQTESDKANASRNTVRAAALPIATYFAARSQYGDKGSQ